MEESGGVDRKNSKKGWYILRRRMEIRERVLLGDYTTFRIGGPARFFVRVEDVSELREALAFAKERELPVLMLGGGSNLLIDDAGFDGLVIKNELMGVELRDQDDGSVLVSAGAGEPWDSLVARTVDEGLWGLENLSGIPGTVGAAPVQNIGAYGAELKDALAWVQVFEPETATMFLLSNPACRFGYRASLFKREPGKFFITRVMVRLRRDGTPNLFYRDLRERFANHPAPALAKIRQAVLDIRARKFPDLSREGTAGSFFLNPLVPATVAQELLQRFPEAPHFPAEGGAVKFPLAWFLDHALNLRGASAGGARLFEQQPLVVVAERGASANDVRALAKTVIGRIKNELGLDIEPEVQIVGEKI